MADIEKGDLVVIRDCAAEIPKSLDDFEIRWRLTYNASHSDKDIGMSISQEFANKEVMSLDYYHLTAKEGNKVKDKENRNKVYVLKYWGGAIKPFINNRFVATVVDIIPDNHSDLDVIKMVETDGTPRVCRRAIVERFVIDNKKETL